MNWMKLACDSAQINLLPFFEKAGMLKPINAYIEDYGAGWNIITEKMIDNLKKHVASKGYPDYTEEINYINAHNFQIYRDNKKLSVPTKMGDGCTYSNGKVKVDHKKVQNAVAFETYNAKDSFIRITMYGLGADDAHSFTMVLYPAATEESDASAYIMAVGYDGTRTKIYEKSNFQKGLEANKFYTITSVGKGNALSCGTGTSIDTKGKITWNLARAAKSNSANFVWFLEKRDGKTYLYNPQSNSYFTGSGSSKTTELCGKANAPYFEVACVDEAKGTYTFNMNGSGQFVNSYNATETGFWGGGSGDANNIWTVEEVTTAELSIPNSGYYMACYPFAIELPECVEANVVSATAKVNYEGTDYQYLGLEKIEGNIVPANMPVVYVGSPAKYKVKLLAEDSTAITTPNILKGTNLKLTGITKGTGMYNPSATEEAGATGMVKVNATANTIPVNRAYLLTTDVDGATEVYFQSSEFVTAISDVEAAASANQKFYELNGMRANKLQKGRIYVTSEGKTILVK
jgi:hypothetical protein